MSDQDVMPTPIFDELVSELHIEITFDDLTPAMPVVAENEADLKAS